MIKKYLSNYRKNSEIANKPVEVPTQEHQRIIKMKRKPDKTMNNMNIQQVLGKVLKDGTVIETYYDPEYQYSLLAIKRNEYEDTVENYTYGEITYVPKMDANIEKGYVQLPSYVPTENVSFDTLFNEVKDFILKYVELDEIKIEIATRYVFMTWVYDRFQRIPYLRIQGTWGTGKSRFLDILAGLTYHSSRLGVGVTYANIFRMLDMYPGTLILDEMDGKGTGKDDLITQILNGGYDRNGFVTRSIQSSGGYTLETYNAFGPKVIASRQPFDDAALESRILSLVSQPKTRGDIPKFLPKYEEWEEIIDLRNKLLKFRMDNYFEIDPNNDVEGLEKYDARTEEILLPIIHVAGETRLPDSVASFADLLIEERMVQKAYSLEGQVAQALADLYKQENPPLINEIANLVNQKNTSKYQINPHRAGSIIRGFGLPTRRTSKGYVVELSKVNIKLITTQYGIDIDSLEVENTATE
jgi:hypothetical protein